uniref:YTH domain-containing protein n=2 Tax=Bursaphelenchus xylophilus TaxID=6326 RepID=A0A1I7SMF6_BURXY
MGSASLGVSLMDYNKSLPDASVLLGQASRPTELTDMAWGADNTSLAASFGLGSTTPIYSQNSLNPYLSYQGMGYYGNVGFDASLGYSGYPLVTPASSTVLEEGQTYSVMQNSQNMSPYTNPYFFPGQC